MDAGGCRRKPRAGEKRGSATGPSPVDRGRAGSKHHLLVDATGIPLAWSVTGGNRNDVTQLIPLLDRVPPVRGKPGRPRRRPDRLTADRGYDHDKYRRLLWQRGVKPEIARRQTAHGSGLGRYRWVVERTFAHLHHFNGCSSATTAATRSTKRFSRSPAASSASGDSRTHFETSS
jgi:transposase